MIHIERFNDEVFIAQDALVYFGNEEIAFVKQKALESPLKRARICAHRTNEDPLHEMLIAISKGSYIHPHKHLNKSESFHVVEGCADVVIFDEKGNITDVVKLGIATPKEQFFYRLSESKFHTLLIRSDIFVVHEVTNGPFQKEDSVLASFAPKDNEAIKINEYMSAISEQVTQYKSRL